MSLGNCKLNWQWDTTRYLLEWLKARTLTTPNASKVLEQQECPFTAGGNAKWYALEDSLTVSYKTKYTLTIQSTNHAHWYLLKWVENISTQKLALECLQHLYS